MKLRTTTYDTYHDLKFTFKSCKITVYCDEEVYDIDIIKKIHQIVNLCSKEIVIDKSYVNYETTTYENTFIKAPGWKELCQLVINSKFGKKSIPHESMIILESYKLLIITYLYHVLSLFNINSEYILIDIKEGSKFVSIIEIDDSQHVFNYPGKWQKW